jgi:hypothetical protein
VASASTKVEYRLRARGSRINLSKRTGWTGSNGGERPAGPAREMGLDQSLIQLKNAGLIFIALGFPAAKKLF